MSLCNSFGPDVPHPKKRRLGFLLIATAHLRMNSPLFPGGLVVRIRAFIALAQVQSLARELRFHKPCGAWLKKKKKEGAVLVASLL